MGNSTAEGFTFGWCREPIEASRYLKQRIFGTLVQLAMPVVQEYQSDLYWDAEFVRSHVNEACTFWYVVRPSGTHTTKDREFAVIAAQGSIGSILYRCNLVQDDGRWTFTTTREEVPAR